MIVDCACVTQIQRLISTQGSSPRECATLSTISVDGGKQAFFEGIIIDDLLRYGTHCVPASDVANLHNHPLYSLCM